VGKNYFVILKLANKTKAYVTIPNDNGEPCFTFAIEEASKFNIMVATNIAIIRGGLYNFFVHDRRITIPDGCNWVIEEVSNGK
jgi:hypothetical protein